MPLTVLPFESVFPAVPPAPVDAPVELTPLALPPAVPPELCAKAKEELTNRMLKISAASFMAFFQIRRRTRINSPST